MVSDKEGINNPSTCHPDRPRSTKSGLCKPCYDKIYYEKRRVKEGISKRLVKDTPCIIHPEVLMTSRMFCYKCNVRKYEVDNRERLTEYRRNWNQENRTSINRKLLDRHRLKKFRVGPTEVDKILEEQKGVCAICFSKDEGKALHLDHCHNSNVVRQFLCQKCNQGLGLFKDNVELLSSAIEYLNKHNKKIKV